MDGWLSVFLMPMPAWPWPFLLLQLPVPLLWLAGAGFVLRRFQMRGVWVVGTFPVAIFGWNAGGILGLALACSHATTC
jgi:hypothetical protein